LELGLFHIDSGRGGDSAHCISIPVSFATHLIWNSSADTVYLGKSEEASKRRRGPSNGKAL
jgi:hypothetical protein